jgi:hypothetical protein
MRVLIKTMAVAAVFAAACTHEVSSEERLDRETASDPKKDAVSQEALEKITCSDTKSDLEKARNENRPETDRVMGYIELYDSLRKRTQTFEEAMIRNPDLAYTEGSAKIVAARDVCVQQTADIKVEFDRYVRELVDVPTVQEIKGGNTVTVARLDFGTLRQAIETLSPDDKDQLLNRVNSAEKKVEVKAPEARKKNK